MTNEDVLEEFRAAGALREGHFILSSGLHSGVFLQKNLVFMHPDRCERLCKALAARIRAVAPQVDLVISPAVGGIIPGYETARQLGVTSLYVEREGGSFKLRRGFAIHPSARIAMVEVGGLVVRDVEAMVLPDESLSENLLGLSFLSRLKRFEYANGMMVLEQ